MANNIVDIEKQINTTVENLPSNDYMLGRGLSQPFSPANSGSRKLMYAVHKEHALVLSNAQIAFVSTGYEDEFGRTSTSYMESDCDYVVVAKIPKFSFRPDDHYYLIVQDINTGVYDYIERVSYNHNTEMYGYMKDTTYLDSLSVGSKINKGDVIDKSVGFDEFNNKMDGVNLITMYLSCDQNMEDSVILSDTAHKLLSADFVRQPKDISINDNDILLNLYGDMNNYKTFPDIGENIKNGIFCAIRRLENSNVFYSLAQTRLMDIMMSDKVITLDGKVVDIDVFCNRPDDLQNSQYNRQICFYYNESMKFYRAINDIVGKLAMNGKLTYKLKKLFARCRDAIGGTQFLRDKPFNNISMQITVVENATCNKGDKVSDRYGGKGIVSKVVPDELMPMLDNGERVHIIKNQSTCMNRENLGQLNEQSLTFMGSRIIDYINTGVLSPTESMDLILDFMKEVSPSQYKYYYNLLMRNNGEVDFNEAKSFVDSVLEDGGIILSIPPYENGINLDKLNDIYKKFPWIKPYKVMVPMEDSNGNIRYIPTRRKLVIGKIYHYRLKQLAEEKFSVTSLCATNVKNLNTRSKANKVYESRFSKTPIMFGAMETGNMAHIGMEYVIMNLMLYSSSPQGRRLFEHLLTGDPYDIDIKLDKDSINRNAEIIEAIFKAMGLRLGFRKIIKKPKYLAKAVMAKLAPLKDFQYKTNIRDIIGHEDELEMRYNQALYSNNPKICNRVMCKVVDKDEEDIIDADYNEIEK